MFGGKCHGFAGAPGRLPSFGMTRRPTEAVDDINEHHQNGYGFCNSPNLIASILARRASDAAIVVGDRLQLHNPPVRVAEEFAMIDCLSGGRLVAGSPRHHCSLASTPQDPSLRSG
jgi:hypothetical protein